ncbi:spore germination protein [Clostridium botulinum]|uniref:spore germination protein n=1 Tax=Clostridium botulinum TaxID=1491 RepID=UPI00035BA10C|nr:spore germination protein [Clostridium botulinum]AJD27073.1 GerA spore germination family protein [Clostridium botulinum CDC_297]EPS53104.1 stage V sporulation protein AF [Clostridium botulinum A1 str. CFSAN002368]APQ98788.1 GerA spore germination family protein [Clostridium botulinum]APU60492.1 GerA spore germination family protein [Clostridium botulinum]AUN03123.1 spore germination protein [Clostridium botulinum]
MILSSNLNETIQSVKNQLAIDKSFDIVGRDITVGNKNAYLVFIDGFAKDQILLFILERLQNLKEEEISVDTIKKLIQTDIAYIEVDTFNSLEPMQTSVLSGGAALFIDGQKEGILLDVREYPVRGPEEPDLEKVTRGARDGLVETIIFNTTLIRRRIRDPQLIFELKTVGSQSKTDVAIGYIDNVVDHKLLDELKNKLDEININALVMAEKTLEELLIKKKWYNPLPQVRFTERPDVVAAHLLEGHIAIIVDTSPSVMLLPVTIFHFTQHAEDYYQNPLVGTYLRWIRFFAMFLAFIISPLWLLLVYNQSSLPYWLTFIGPKEIGPIPLFIQFVLLEFGLDFLRTASIHTPNTLSTSLGIIGGLILSELAVKVGWFVPETILYMAIAGIGTFSSPSIEFGMAIRIFRLFLIISTGLFKTIGFFAGLLIILIIICTTKAFGNQSYLWPLIPFDKKAFGNMFLRRPIPEIRNNKKS